MPCGTRQLSMADITPRFELLGLVCIIDPPRPEAMAAVAECQRAGIRVKMITGDHALTAAAIGAQLGLATSHTLTGEDIEAMDDEALKNRVLDTDVFARASPVHKLRLVHALQAQGHLVAMTGDGVNDAPALKAANMGVAMGHKGTDAAREASDLVLTDDNFATIARAVREGRVVFDNIKKTLLFTLPTNGGEAGVILLAIFWGVALPVTAGQILWVNLITAVTLSLAFAFEPGEEGVMRHGPLPPTEPLLTRPLVLRMVFVSLLMVMVMFSVFEWEPLSWQQPGVVVHRCRQHAGGQRAVLPVSCPPIHPLCLSSGNLHGQPGGHRRELADGGAAAAFYLRPFHAGGVPDARPELEQLGCDRRTGLRLFLVIELEKALLRWFGVRRM